MSQPVIQTSFGAGELSINLYGRVDLEKYHSGAALVRNFFVDYRGGVSTRTGGEFIAQSKSTGITRITRFQPSSQQSYLLEWSNEALRFYYLGNPLIDQTATVTGVSNASSGVFTCSNTFSNGDTVILSGFVGLNQTNRLSGLNGRTCLVTNQNAAHVTLTDLFGNAISTAGLTAWSLGGILQRVYTLPTPYAAADLFDLKFVQSADVLTITHPNYPQYDLTQVSASSFDLTQTTFASSIAAPAGLEGFATSPSSNNYNYGYLVTAVGNNGLEESLPSSYVVIASEVLDPTSGWQINLQWDAVPGVNYYQIYKWGPVVNTHGHVIDDTVFGYIGQATTTVFTDNNIAPDFTRTPPMDNDPFAPGAITSLSVNAQGTLYNGPSSYVPLTITDAGPGTGATGYAICDPTTGFIVGAVLLTRGKNYVAPIITPGGSGSGATFTTTLSPTTGNYPSCCTYYQQRRTYAATLNNPQQVNLSRNGVYTNFNDSLIESDDDAIEISIASREVNAIQSMTAMPLGLVILTTDGAFLLSGGTPQAAVTPSNVVCLPQASPGSSKLPALRVNYNLLYVQARGATVRDMTFSFYTQSYYGYDRSALANHLFFGFTIVDWDYAEEPFRLILGCRSDGQMVVMTYVPEQEIYAWAHYDTAPTLAGDGNYISIQQVIEGQENAIYTVTQRTINGNTVNYIERFASRDFSDDVTQYEGVDASLQATVTDATVVGGLWHLIGENVTGLANGMVVNGTVDANGNVIIPETTGTVTLGLGYVCQLQTLYLDTGEPTIQGKFKQINAMTLRVDDTRGLSAGPDFNTLTPIKDLNKFPYTPPAGLIDGDIRLLITSYWTTQGQMAVQQSYPLPATILGIMPEVVIGSTQR